MFSKNWLLVAKIFRKNHHNSTLKLPSNSFHILCNQKLEQFLSLSDSSITKDIAACVISCQLWRWNSQNIDGTILFKPCTIVSVHYNYPKRNTWLQTDWTILFWTVALCEYDFYEKKNLQKYAKFCVFFKKFGLHGPRNVQHFL